MKIHLEKEQEEKKSGRAKKMEDVLFALIETNLETGKPIGSNTLKEKEFPDVSSATLRNYFADLEEMGYLDQAHASSGRIPTAKAFFLYAQKNNKENKSAKKWKDIEKMRQDGQKEINTYLRQAAETISELSSCAVFISSPRFDHDFIKTIKLLSLEGKKVLFILITEYGQVHTELLQTKVKLTKFSIGRLESYFTYRLRGFGEPENLSNEEHAFAKTIFNELMVRHIVTYASLPDYTLFKTGFSNLLKHPEFQDPATLTSCLTLMEENKSIKLIMRDVMKASKMKFWIGEDLSPFSFLSQECAIVAIPYTIQQQTAGAIALLGPYRMPYKQIFSILNQASSALSETLTKTIYQFKLSYRMDKDATSVEINPLLTDQKTIMLLEDLSNKEKHER